MKQAQAIEVVNATFPADVSREDVLHAANIMQSWIETQAGFIDRQLLEGEDGQWLDVVWWATMDEALAAAEAAMQAEELAPAMGVFGKAELTMHHLKPAALNMAG